MSRSTRMIPAAFLAALALAVLTAAPAYAASPGATPTLTITPQSVSQLPLLDFTGGCPAGSDDVEIETPAGSFISPTLDGADDFSAVGYASQNWGAVGDTLTFIVTCSTGGVDSPTATQSITLPDYGASVTIPATVRFDEPITATGTCGSAPGSQEVIFGYFYSGGASITTQRITEDGGPFVASALYTPQLLGAAVGSVLRVNAFCVTPLLGGGEAYYAVPQSNSFTVVAPLVPADHATLTATVVDPTDEDSPIDFAGECGPGADYAELHWGTDSAFYEALSASQTFTETEGARLFGEPGEVVPFWVVCRDSANMQIGISAPPLQITLPDTGSFVTMAASFTTTQRLNLSGSCGTSGATQVVVLFGEGGTVYDGFIRPISGPTYSFTDMPTPAGLAIGATTEGFVEVSCFRAGDVESLDSVSQRVADFAVTVAPKALPATGMDVAAPLTAGGILLVAGVALFVLRRRAA